MNGIRFFGFSLLLLKLSGGFPFWQHASKPRGSCKLLHRQQKRGFGEEIRSGLQRRNNQVVAGPQDSSLTYYRPSRWWRLWSYLVAILVVSNFAYFVCMSAVLDRDLDLDITEHTATWLGYILNGVAEISMLLYLLKYQTLAVNLVENLHTLLLSNDALSKSLHYDWYFVLSVVAMTLGFVCIWVNTCMKYILAQSLYLVNETFELFFICLMFSSVISFFFTAIRHESLMYRNIRHSLTEFYYREDNKNTVYDCKQMYIYDPSDHTSDGLLVREVVGRGGISDQVGAIGRSEGGLLLRATQENLLECHAFHRLLLDYLSLPITLIMLVSVYHSVVSAYYLSLFPSLLEVRGKALAVSYGVATCLPLLILSNIPVILQVQVDQLRLVLQELLHRQEDDNTEREVRKVLEVLKEWPGFQLCRIFTLGRACMVDVFSFVSTYLVILLQFRLTERGLATHLTNITGS